MTPSLNFSYLCGKTKGMQFVDIKNDIAFRKIFGNENKKIILISFLNAVMKLKGKDAIEDVEILNPYQLPIIKNLKASIIDVKARDKKGKTYIIEMQVAEPDGLDKHTNQDANKHSWTKEELEAYDYAAMREQDERGRVELAEKRTKFEVARKMKAEGFNSDTISRLLGLSIAEIDEI